MPGRVLAVDGGSALIDTAAGRRRASTLLIPDILPGELVAIAAGTIIDRLTESEAADLSRLLNPALFERSLNPGRTP